MPLCKAYFELHQMSCAHTGVVHLSQNAKLFMLCADVRRQLEIPAGKTS